MLFKENAILVLKVKAFLISLYLSQVEFVQVLLEMLWILFGIFHVGIGNIPVCVQSNSPPVKTSCPNVS